MNGGVVCFFFFFWVESMKKRSKEKRVKFALNGGFLCIK